MNWFEYIRGYDDGQQDGRLYRRNYKRGMFISILMLVSKLVWLTIMIAYLLLRGIFTLLKIVFLKLKK